QLVSADLLDPARDPIPVQRAHRFQRLQHHQAQGSVEDIALVGRHVLEAYSYDVLAVKWWGSRRRHPKIDTKGSAIPSSDGLPAAGLFSFAADDQQGECHASIR